MNQIRTAKLSDVPYMIGLANRMSHAVGFIPRLGYVERIDGTRRGGITIATENDEPAGFLLYGPLIGSEIRIFQTAIQFDAQRRHHGEALVRDLERRIHESHESARMIGGNSCALVDPVLSLRCAADLEANAFWKSMGFVRRGIESATGRPLIRWTKRL